MNEEQLKKMIENTYEDSKEDTIRSMIGDFYNRRMLSIVIFLWTYALVFIALAIFSGIKFFDVEQPRSQLMYAVIFICCVQFIALLKIFAWQMIHRNSIKREIKRLELRIAELNRIIKVNE